MRRTRLAPGKGLTRRTQLRSAATLARGKGLAARSKKQQAAYRERIRMLAAMVRAEHGPIVCAVPDCGELAQDPHEPLTRARGGSITDPDNVTLICRRHHEEIHLEPAWAYQLGFLRHSWEAKS